jgi:N-acetyl-gamma-glutamyl-phosphate reductase
VIRAGIIGATGYAGAELARLLCQHPEVKLASVASIEEVGRPLREVFPNLWPTEVRVLEELDEVDLVLAALPHVVSAKLLLPYIQRGLPVIDLSADFRLHRLDEYARWYRAEHPAPELLGKAVYGLPELHRQEIVGSPLIAVAGCYPTSAILALAPAVKAGVIEPDIIVDSKSGVSGAGRALGLTSHYAEANEGVRAYALDGHRHLPEIVQELSLLREGPAPSVTFLPHVVPMTRGILSTCYARLREGALPGGQSAAEELRTLYRDFYRDEPFTAVVEAPPNTKHTLGNNLCLIHPALDERTGRLIVVSCLDNLVKGAAGQAIQCMNIMLGFPETAGLQQLAVYP